MKHNKNRPPPLTARKNNAGKYVPTVRNSKTDKETVVKKQCNIVLPHCKGQAAKAVAKYWPPVQNLKTDYPFSCICKIVC